MVFNPEIAPPSQVKYGKNYQRLVGSKILKRKTLSKLSLRMKDGTVIGKSKEGSKGLFHDYFMDYIQMSKMKKTSLPDN